MNLGLYLTAGTLLAAAVAGCLEPRDVRAGDLVLHISMRETEYRNWRDVSFEWRVTNEASEAVRLYCEASYHYPWGLRLLLVVPSGGTAIGSSSVVPGLLCESKRLDSGDGFGGEGSFEDFGFVQGRNPYEFEERGPHRLRAEMVDGGDPSNEVTFVLL